MYNKSTTAVDALCLMLPASRCATGGPRSKLNASREHNPIIGQHFISLVCATHQQHTVTNVINYNGLCNEKVSAAHVNARMNSRSQEHLWTRTSMKWKLGPQKVTAAGLTRADLELRCTLNLGSPLYWYVIRQPRLLWIRLLKFKAGLRFEK